MLVWLMKFLKSFGKNGVSVSISLPSFHKEIKEDDMPSLSSDFDDEAIKGITTSRDYKLAHQELIKRFSRLTTAFSERFPGKTLLITCTYRSPEEQNRLYRLGRKGNEVVDSSKVVTKINGVTKLSNHNKYPARAIDVAVMNGGKITWNEADYYPLLALSKEFDLVSGGSWDGFLDWPHLELPKDVV